MGNRFSEHMFFFRKRSVIFFGRDIIRAAETSHSGKCVPTSKYESSWTTETLVSTLNRFRSIVPGRTRIILAEEWVYSVIVPIGKDSAHDRVAVAEAIRDRIPEELSDTVWDFSLMKSAQSSGGKETFIHAVVVKKRCFDDIIKPFRSAGFSIESIDAESCALARLFRREREPIILARGETDGRTLVAAVNQGPPFSTEIIEPERAEEVKRFVESLRARSGMDFKRAYCSPLVPEAVRTALEHAGLSVDIRDFDLCSGAMAKGHVFGKDSAVLNLAK